MINNHCRKIQTIEIFSDHYSKLFTSLSLATPAFLRKDPKTKQRNDDERINEKQNWKNDQKWAETILLNDQSFKSRLMYESVCVCRNRIIIGRWQ